MLNLSGRELLSIPDPPFGRREYIRAGIVLMALKYTVDAALIYWTTGLVWTPADYLLSLANISNSKGALFTLGLSMTLIVWTIPFVWIGVILSVRRAKDAGLPPWIVVAFFIPVLNYLLMAMLAAWPRAESVPARVDERQVTALDRTAVARKGLLAGITAGLVAGIVSVVLGALFIKSYGAVMFLLTPFIVGLVSAYASRRVNPWSPLPLKVVLYTLGVMAGAFLVFALEGIGCVLMALPLAVPLAVLGGVVGHFMARHHRAPGTLALLLIALPAGHGIDRVFDAVPTREVVSAIEISAPPATVWKHVVSFEEIRTPPPWYLQGRTRVSDPRTHRRQRCWRSAQVRVHNRCFHRTDHSVGRAASIGVRRHLATRTTSGVEPVPERLRAAPGRLFPDHPRRVPAGLPTGRTNAPRGKDVVHAANAAARVLDDPGRHDHPQHPPASSRSHQTGS